MQQFADQHRTDREFEIGDKVFVKLQPYRQSSMVCLSNQKLALKYYDPYEILDRCGKVAYKLKLPATSLVHAVFHVSQLKEAVGRLLSSSELPTVLMDVDVKEPEMVLERKMVKRQNKAATMVLVKWKGQGHEEATLEFLFDLQRRFPAFQPCGQGV